LSNVLFNFSSLILSPEVNFCGLASLMSYDRHFHSKTSSFIEPIWWKNTNSFILHPASFILHYSFYTKRLAFYLHRTNLLKEHELLHPASFILHYSFYTKRLPFYLYQTNLTKEVELLHSVSFILHYSFYIFHSSSFSLHRTNWEKKNFQFLHWNSVLRILQNKF